MVMNERMEKFKKSVKSQIPDINIGYKEFEDGYVQIFYYSKANPEEIFEVLGEALEINFLNDEIFNIGLRRVIDERFEEYFPNETLKS